MTRIRFKLRVLRMISCAQARGIESGFELHFETSLSQYFKLIRKLFIECKIGYRVRDFAAVVDCAGAIIPTQLYHNLFINLIISKHFLCRLISEIWYVSR